MMDRSYDPFFPLHQTLVLHVRSVSFGSQVVVFLVRLCGGAKVFKPSSHTLTDGLICKL
jgi:hypothetical protein